MHNISVTLISSTWIVNNNNKEVYDNLGQDGNMVKKRIMQIIIFKVFIFKGPHMTNCSKISAFLPLLQMCILHITADSFPLHATALDVPLFLPLTSLLPPDSALGCLNP